MGTFARKLQAESGLDAPFRSLPVPPTLLVGREREVAEVSQLLRRDDVRLLTLTGPPGIGKTRLAIEVANTLPTEFVHGVYFIDLIPVTDPSLVLPAIAYHLGLHRVNTTDPITILQNFLSNRHILLVLDNFEHVIQAAPALSEVLPAAHHVKVLVTSRELLRISREYNFPVPPLPLPPVLADQGAPRTLALLPPERISEYDSVQLFVQRAAALKPGFALTLDNALLVAGICCRLDGLPLAIELAAARVRHIPLQNIYDRLEKCLHILTGGARDLPLRQRTLRTAIEWSYDLLDNAERLLFARLAVFRGGCSLDGIEAVCGKELSIDVFEGLASLVDKSLVQQQENTKGEARFVLLEMIREFAHEQLQASGELETLRRRHAEYFGDLADRAETELRLAHQNYWFHLLEAEIDNLRAALAWSLESGDVACAIRIMSGTCLYWIVYARQAEGIHWFQQLLTRINEAAQEYHIRLLRNAALLIVYHDREAAQRLAERAVALAREHSDIRQLGWTLWALSTTLPGGAEAEALTQEALVLLRQADDLPGLGLVFNSIGERARLSGNVERARNAYEKSLAIAERTGDTRRQYYVLFNLAFVAQHEGNHQEAIRMIRRSLTLCQELGVATDLAQELLALAGSLGALGEPVRAAHLFSAARAFLQRSDVLIDPNDRPEHDRNIAFVRDQLGETAFEAAWAEGQAMTFDQALAYAHSVFASYDLSVPHLQPDKEIHALSDLTRREREVARLIAQGRSNRVIADELVVSERTVEGHVSNILSKLGFRSRAQVSAWVVEHTRSNR